MKKRAASKEVATQHHIEGKQQPMIVSVDADGIITAHAKADVWPYDTDGTTAVQVPTPYGYVLVTVQRFDR